MHLDSDIVHREERFGGVAFHLETKRFFPLNEPAYWLLERIETSTPRDQLISGFAKLYKNNTSELLPPYKAELIVDGFLWELFSTGILRGGAWMQDSSRNLGDLEQQTISSQSFDLYKNPLRSPLVVSLAVLFQCNLFCNHCYVTSSNETKPDRLSNSEFTEILSGLAAEDVFDVVITGGEPLMLDDIYQVLSHAKDVGLYVCLNSNGTIVTNRVARRIFDTGIDVVKVSIDSPHSKIHDQFRGQVRAWERSINGIRHLVEAGVRVDTHTVISVDSMASREDLEGLLALGSRLGVSQMHFGRVFSTGRSTDALKLSRKHVLGLIRHLHNLKGQGHPLVGRLPSTSMPKVSSLPTYDGCGQCARTNYAYIAYNGEVYPCTNLYKKRWCLGSLKQTNLSTILGRSEILRELDGKLASARTAGGNTGVGIHT